MANSICNVPSLALHEKSTDVFTSVLSNVIISKYLGSDYAQSEIIPAQELLP